MEILRTPDDRFADLPDFPFPPHYVDVADPATPDDVLRMHYVDEGPSQAAVVVLLHGEPTWSYLYRHVIGSLADAGHRVIAPDLVGFGRSDKPADIADHTYARHVAWTRALLDAVGLDGVTWVGQDWGGLIGLRLLAEQPDRFAGFVAANTALPTGDQRMPDVWHAFRQMVNDAERLDIARMVRSGTVRTLSPQEAAAYEAPFPDERYMAGPRAMPEQVPYHPDHPAADDNRRAWRQLGKIDVRFLTAFSDRDPITAGADRVLRDHVPGADAQAHTTITDAGHFLQEDAGDRLARVVLSFLATA